MGNKKGTVIEDSLLFSRVFPSKISTRADKFNYISKKTNLNTEIIVEKFPIERYHRINTKLGG